MKTRITELFGIQYPIILSGMTGVSTPELVASVSNEGGLGILATANLNADQTRQAIRKIRGLTSKPFGANVPLMLPGAEKKAQTLFDEKVPVINYALGKGNSLVKKARAYNGKVIATVATYKHALAARRDGADALIVTGHEAAAHGGDVTSLVLVPSIVDAVDIPVIAAGGFADGRGLAAAMALGADGVAMGTRFMNTVESPVHPHTKHASIEKTVHDTVYTDRVDGLPCRVMKSRGAQRLMNDRIPLIRALFTSRDAAKAFGFPWITMLLGILAAGWQKSIQLARMANAFRPIQKSLDDGNWEDGVIPLGQITGIIHDTPTVKELLERLIIEAAAAHQNAALKFEG
ncbi:MAG: nitronate monooxygenase [Desulfobacterales bacterium]|jgi:enoyl-[acyl-carrier protein] reductase II|nr:nitronate monooxygenase [Desulfobacterales bacterium]